MQTFWPVKDLATSARTLDPNRLRNQRNEVKALLRTITGLDVPGWSRHPAALMWWGFPEALAVYGMSITTECYERDYPDAWFFLDDAERMFKRKKFVRKHARLILDTRRESPTKGQRVLALPASMYFASMLPKGKSDADAPNWIGYEPFHASHRSNLLRKYPDWYRKYWPDDHDDLDYVWPSHLAQFPTLRN